MKKIQVSIIAGLLCAMVVLFINCKKETVDPPSIWNYSSFKDDRDGKSYKSIKVGNQEWMAENLAYSVTGSWTYWNDDKDGILYGRLYTWDAAKQAIPAGWHLPSDTEWKQLEIALGMSQVEADGIDFRGTDEGAKLKALKGWIGDDNGTDYVGLACKPGGFRSSSSIFLGRESYGYWWTSTESDSSSAWFRLITYFKSQMNRNVNFKGEAYSVRCVKN